MKTATLPASAGGARTSWGAIALFCVLWSSAFASAKIALRDCPPLTLLASRFCIAGVLMLAVAALTGGWRRIPRRDFLVLVGLGIFNNGLYLGLSWSGMATVSSAFTSVLISTNPLLVGLLAGPVLGERLNWRKLVGLLLGLLGVMLVLRSRLLGSEAHEDLGGTLLVVGGLLGLVCGTLAYKKLKPRANLWMATGIQSLAGGLALWPVALHFESLAQAQFTASLFWSMAYTIIAVSMGSYYLWFLILERHSATAASALHFLMPPLGLFFGWLVLREPVSWLDMVGILPIAFGIWLATRRPV